MKSRKLACQALERRNLLAALTCPTGLMSTDSSVAVGEQPAAQWGSIEQLRTEESANASIGQGDYTDPDAPFTIWNPIRNESFTEATGRDLIEENSGLVATIRTHQLTEGSQRSRYEPVLHLYQRNDDNSLTELASEKLNFIPRRLIVTDTKVIAVGDTVHGEFDTAAIPRRTSLLHISRDNLSQRNYSTVEGHYQNAFEKEDRLYLTTFGHTQQHLIIFPSPQVPYTLTVLDTESDSLDQIAQGFLPNVVTENMVAGNDILSVQPGFHDTILTPIVVLDAEPISVPAPTQLFPSPQNKLVRYRIEDQQIVVAGELELESNMTHTEIELSTDQKSAVITGFNHSINPRSGESSRSPLVDVFLVDLSQDTPSLFEHIEITGVRNDLVIEIGETVTAISTAGDNVYLINTDQTIDLAAESRLTRLDLPTLPDSAIPRVSSIKEIRPDEFIVIRPATVPGEPILGLFDGVVLPQSLKHELTLVSGDQSSVVSSTQAVGSAFALFSDTSDTPILAGVAPSHLGPRDSRLAALRFDTTGNATSMGSVSTTAVIELDADAERILLRYFDRLTEYRWEDLNSPIQTPIGDEVPPPVAVDDDIDHVAHSNARYLNVLANDHIPFSDQLPSLRIVELINAPDFVTLDASNHLLFLTNDVVSAEGTYEFQYVIERSGIRSSANVRLNLIRFDDGETQQAIEAITSAAAQQLEISADEIQFAAVHEYIAFQMSNRTPEGDINPLGGQYGVIAEVTVGERHYRFAANFQGQVELIAEGLRNPVIDLSMKAVDADGNELAQISAGDSFFLEITAEDLRAFGQGVFGIGFDLPLPSNTLTPTGELVLLGEWSHYGDPVQSDEIDEFHAVEVLIEHPGSAAQPVVRIGVQAISGGEVTLRMNPADQLGVEMLLRGDNDVISPVHVNYGELDLTIQGLEATDIDGSGATTPRDALQIINFLSRHGSVEIAALQNLDGPAEPELSSHDVARLQRLDTSGDGRITAVDALLVINQLARQFSQTTAEAERVDAVLTLGLDKDDRSSEIENSEIADEAMLLF